MENTKLRTGEKNFGNEWINLPLFSSNGESPNDLLDVEPRNGEPPPNLLKENEVGGDFDEFELWGSETVEPLSAKTETAKTTETAAGEKHLPVICGEREVFDSVSPVTPESANQLPSGVDQSGKSTPENLLKNSRRQKRFVEGVKIFFTPEERTYLKQSAAQRGESFSNFVRFHLGLPPNAAGRKRRKNRSGV